MKGKRLCMLLLIAVMMFLCGCGRQRIGICFRDTGAGVTSQLMRQMAEELKAQGYQVTAVGAANDQAGQNGQISRFLERKYDLLIVEPVMTAEAGEIVRVAEGADVPLIFLNYEPDEAVLNSWEKLCYIGCDLAQPGEVQNELVKSLLSGGDVNADGSMNYLLISGPEDHMDAKVWEESYTQLQNARCLGVEHGQWNSQSGEAIAGRCLGKYAEELEVIFCLDDEMALGAREAIEAAGRTVGEDIYLVGLGGQWQALTLVAGNDMTGTVCPDVFALAKTTADTADRLLSRERVEKRICLNFVPVTAENVQDFLQ